MRFRDRFFNLDTLKYLSRKLSEFAVISTLISGPISCASEDYESKANKNDPDKVLNFDLYSDSAHKENISKTNIKVYPSSINESIRDFDEDAMLPVGRYMSNGTTELSYESIDEIKRIWENKEFISGELPKPILDLINSAFYKAYGVPIPSDLKLCILSNAEYDELFGNSVALYVSFNRTMYIREGEFGLPTILSITHEMGHAYQHLFYGIRHVESMSWFMHYDLLLEMEGMLPAIGKAPYVLQIPELTQCEFNLVYETPMNETFYPFFSIYHHWIHSAWEVELELQAGNKISTSYIDGMAGWILLGQLGSFEKVREVLPAMNAKEVRELVKTVRTKEEFFDLMQVCIDAITSRVENSTFGAYKNQDLYYYIYKQSANTFKLQRYGWLWKNIYMIGVEPDDLCYIFKPESVEAGCYSPVYRPFNTDYYSSSGLVYPENFELDSNKPISKIKPKPHF